MCELMISASHLGWKPEAARIFRRSAIHFGSWLAQELHRSLSPVLRELVAGALNGAGGLVSSARHRLRHRGRQGGGRADRPDARQSTPLAPCNLSEGSP